MRRSRGSRCGRVAAPRAPAIARFEKRSSGPLLDHFDIHFDAPRIADEQLADTLAGEPSAAIREVVETPRGRQVQQYAATTHVNNADVGPRELPTHAAPDEAGRA